MIEGCADVPPERRENVRETADLLAGALLPPDDGGDLDRLVSVPVTCRRPKALEFFRTRPGPEWTAGLLMHRPKVDGMGGDWYAVDRSIAPHLGGQVRPFDLRLAVNRAGAVLVIPIPRGDGTRDSLRSSLLKAMTEAERQWVRIEWNGAAGGYSMYEAQGDLPDPVWPDTAIPTMGAAVEAAFSGYIVADEEHPIIRRARGLE